AAVEERREDLAVLLALGADARALTGAVIREAVTLAAVGAMLGSAAGLVLRVVLDHVLPVIPLAFRVTDAARILLVFAAAGIGAAAIPAARLRRIDPLEAFRPGWSWNWTGYGGHGASDRMRSRRSVMCLWPSAGVNSCSLRGRAGRASARRRPSRP